MRTLRNRIPRPPARVAASIVLIGLAAVTLPAAVTGRVHAGRPPRASLLAQQPAQVERGAAIFRAHCTKCHGTEGHGGDGPRLVGTPNGLSGYETTPKLYEFIRTNMPMSDPGALKDEEYWDVLAFLLDANRLLPPGIVLGPDTADGVSLTP